MRSEIVRCLRCLRRWTFYNYFFRPAPTICPECIRCMTQQATLVEEISECAREWKAIDAEKGVPA